MCVCWQLKRSQRHLSIDRADPTSSTNEARRCSRSQCSPPAVAPKTRSPAQMMFIGQSIVFAVCLVADSETLREPLPGLYRVSIASLWGLFRVSALSESALCRFAAAHAAEGAADLARYRNASNDKWFKIYYRSQVTLFPNTNGRNAWRRIPCKWLSGVLTLYWL